MKMKVACGVMAMCMLVAPIAKGVLTCDYVFAKLAPCDDYLKGRSTINLPTTACCAGVWRIIYNMTTYDERQNGCYCVKDYFSYSYAIPDNADMLFTRCERGSYHHFNSIDCDVSVIFSRFRLYTFFYHYFVMVRFKHTTFYLFIRKN